MSLAWYEVAVGNTVSDRILSVMYPLENAKSTIDRD